MRRGASESAAQRNAEMKLFILEARPRIAYQSSSIKRRL